MVTDVTHPLIGADFLSHFGLLLDSRNKRLLEEITSSSVSAQAARSLIPSVKDINGDTSVDSHFSKFPDLIRPTGNQHELRHNTVNHIRTTPVSPITCRPRQLEADRLAITKTNFDAMLRDGINLRSES
jgi:hypothetical protein